MGLGDMLRIVRTHLWLIIVSTLAFTGVGFLYANSLTPIYQATATVLIDSRKKNIIELDSVVSEIRADTPTIESEVEIVLTSRIANQVVKSLDLQADPDFGAYWEGDVGKPSVVSNTGKDQSRLDPGSRKSRNNDEVVRASLALSVDILKSNLFVRRVRNTHLIEISFSSPDRFKAAKIANEIARAYLNDQVKSKMNTAQLANGWLEQRIDKLRKNVAASERAIEQFKRENSLVETEGHRLEERQLSRLMEQMILARANRAEAAAKYSQVQELLDQPASKANLDGVLKSQTVRIMKDLLAKTTRKRAELLTRYGPRHPEIKKINAEVDDIEGQIDDEVNRIVSNLRNENKIAEDRLATLEEGVRQASRATSDSNQVALKLAELERQAKADRDVYNHFLMRLKQTAEQTSLQLPDGRLAQKATVPYAPKSPRKRRIMAMFSGAGLALALLFAFGSEFLSTSIRRPEEIEARFSLPHLASIQDVPGLASRDADELRALRLSLLEPRSTYAESVRNLRSAVDSAFSRIHQRQDAGRTILVTSAQENEGKTTLASNLALSFAASGQKVLLIDADIRKPALTIRTFPQRYLGLMDCLQQNVPMTKAIQFDRTSGIHFLPAASIEMDVTASADLLLSPATGAALTDLKQHFNVIVIDTAPVLPIADTRMLADFADQIVLSVQWNKTPHQSVTRALRYLAANLLKVAGIALNKTAPSLVPNYGTGNRQKELQDSGRIAGHIRETEIG